MIEAMACGTPVIAFRRGSVPEIVENGVTGFVVDSDDEAVAAIARLGTLDRARIRRRFEQRFSVRRMAEDYIRVYGNLAGQSGHSGQRQGVPCPRFEPKISPSRRSR
jgi:glycosyltransferase involved in cell wall biosynthesis